MTWMAGADSLTGSCTDARPQNVTTYCREGDVHVDMATTGSPGCAAPSTGYRLQREVLPRGLLCIVDVAVGLQCSFQDGLAH